MSCVKSKSGTIRNRNASTDAKQGRDGSKKPPPASTLKRLNAKRNPAPTVANAATYQSAENATAADRKLRVGHHLKTTAPAKKDGHRLGGNAFV